MLEIDSHPRTYLPAIGAAQQPSPMPRAEVRLEATDGQTQFKLGDVIRMDLVSSLFNAKAWTLTNEESNASPTPASPASAKLRPAQEPHRIQ